MKKIVALFTLSLIFGAAMSRAQTNWYWDTTGATAGVGGTGSWTTTGTTWTTNAAGSDATVSGAWVAGNSNFANFQGTAGIVTISASVYMNQAYVNTNGYTFATSGSTSRYIYATNTNTAAIILADGITLNLSSGIVAYAAGALGIVGNVTNTGPVASTIAITGNSGTTAGSGIRVLSRVGASGTAGTNHWYVNLNIKTTGTGGAILGTADSGAWLVLRNPVTVDSGSRLVLSPGGSTTRTILVSNSITTSAADALAIGETGNTGLVVLRHSNNVITGNLNVIGQLGYQGSLNSLGTARVVLTQGSTFGQSGTISGTSETIANPISIQGDTTFGGLANSCYFGGDIDLTAGTRTVNMANSTVLSGAMTNGSLIYTNSSSSRTNTFNGPLTLTNLSIFGRGTALLNGTNVINNLIISNTLGNSVVLGSASSNTINSLTVNAGTLSAANLGGGSKTFTLTGIGATATFSNTAASGSLAVGPLTLGGSNNFVMATSGSMSVASSGAITLSGLSNVITLTGSVLSSGQTYSLFSGTSVSTNGLTGPVTLTGLGVNNAPGLVLNGPAITSGANIYTFRSTATTLELQVDPNLTLNYSWSGGASGVWNTVDTNWTLDGSAAAFTSGGNAAIDTTTSSVGLTVDPTGISAGYVTVSGGTSASLDGGNLNSLGLTTTGTSLTVNNAVTTTNFFVTNSSVSGSGSISTVAGTTVQCDTDQSLSVALSGTGGVTKSGAGTLTVSGTNSTYIGNLVVSSGALATSGSKAIPDNATLVLSNATTLNLGGNETIGALSAAYGSTNNLGTNTLTAGGNNQSYTNGALTYGSGGIVKNGKGIMYMNQSLNTYSGGFTLNDGEVAYTSSGSAGSDGVVTNSVFGSGTLTLNGGTVRSSSDTSGRNIFNTVVINGDITFGSNSAAATITVSKDANKTTTITKDVTITNVGAVNWEQSIVGPDYRLTKAGVTSTNSAGSTNLISFKNSNNISGMTLVGGTVGYKNRNAFGTGTLILKEGVTVGQDGAINNTPLSGNDLTDRTVPNGVRLDGSVTLGIVSTFNFFGGDIDLTGGSRTITLGNSTFLLGSITNGVQLVIDNGTGAGTRTLSLFASNNYTGGTVVRTNAALAVGHDQALGSGELIFTNTTGSGAAILRASTLSTNATQVRIIGNNIKLASGMTVTLDGLTGVQDSVGNTNTVAVDLVLAGNISGAGGLTKSNNNRVTLRGANSYSGATAVVNGTLVVITNNISANITSNTIAITFSNTPANGTYAVLPGALTGAYTATYTNLSSSQKATFSTVSPASVTVATKSIQSITGLASTDSKTVGDPTYTLSVTPGDSTSPLTFSSDNTSVATVSSAGLVAIVGAGSTTIRVNQAADATYLAATEVTQTLTVARANPTGSTFDDAYPGKIMTDFAPNGLTWLANYAFGGNATTQATLPVQDTSDPTKLRLVVVFRTDDSTLPLTALGGEATTDLDLAGSWSTSGVSVGDSTDLSPVPPNTIRKVISVDVVSSDSRRFLRATITK